MRIKQVDTTSDRHHCQGNDTPVWSIHIQTVKITFWRNCLHRCMNSYRAQVLYPSLPTHPHSYKKSACCFLSTCSSCYDVWHTYDIRILSWLCLGRGEGGVIWAFLIILQKYFLIKQWTYSVFVQNFISVGRVYMYLILFYKKKKFTTW